MKTNVIKTYGILSICGGVLWVIVKHLINQTPQPFNYDDYNRMFTIPLLFMLISFIGFYTVYMKRLTKIARIAGKIGILGLVLLLLGNVLEFWVVLFQSKPNAYAAFSNGSSEVFIGSYLGWMIFCIGLLLIAITSLIVGIISIKNKIAKYWNLFIPFFGIVGLLSFGYDLFLIPFGIGWVTMGYYLLNYKL